MILVLLLLLFFTSCHTTTEPSISFSQENTTVFSGQAMTMNYKIIIGQHLTEHQLPPLTRLINSTFQEIDQVYNKWNPNSELSRLNKLKAKIETPLSPNLARLLKEADLIVRLSEGRFDPTIEPIKVLWSQKLTNDSIPTSQELKRLTPSIGWHHIHFENDIFYKDHDLTQIDLSGIAKGWGIDIMVQRLNAANYPNVFVEWGGEIRASGEHPDKRPWTVYISRLGNSNPDEAIATLYLNNQAIATSGDYLQNWTLRLRSTSNNETKRRTITYFHIFDPKTFQPLEATHTSVASASVLAPTCAFADGLATAAMLFPSVNEAKTWMNKIKEKYPEIAFWIVTREKSNE